MMLRNGSSGTDTAAYDAWLAKLLTSDCVAGVALLDIAAGRPFYENRRDPRLLPSRPPAPPAPTHPPPPPAPRATMKGDEHEEGGRTGGEQGNSPHKLHQRDHHDHHYGLVSPSEGRQLVAAVRGLTEEGLCRQEVLTCMGMPFRVFGGSPLGVYAVGPGRRTGLVARALPRVGFLVVFYRRPHLPQQVVPCVENFVDDFWTKVRDFGDRLPP